MNANSNLAMVLLVILLVQMNACKDEESGGTADSRPSMSFSGADKGNTVPMPDSQGWRALSLHLTFLPQTELTRFSGEYPENWPSDISLPDNTYVAKKSFHPLEGREFYFSGVIQCNASELHEAIESALVSAGYENGEVKERDSLPAAKGMKRIIHEFPGGTKTKASATKVTLVYGETDSDWIFFAVEGSLS